MSGSPHPPAAAWRAASVVGLGLLLAAFLALGAGLVGPEDPSYLLANGLGAGLLAGYAVRIREWVFVVLETVWALASLWRLAAIL